MSLMTKNLVLAGVCAALAVPTFLQLRSEVDTFVDLGRVPRMFEGFTADNVGTIVLARPQDEQPEAAPAPGQQAPPVAYDQLALQRDKDGEGFHIAQLPGQPAVALAGAPVLEARVESDVFQHLRMIRNDPETLVQPAATPEQLESYGLDDASAFVIRVSDRGDKNVVAELLVGDDAGGGARGTEAVRGVFVRERGSNDVVLYEWQTPWRRDLEANGWVDPVLVRVAPEKVRRLSIRNTAGNGKTFVFERQQNRASWQATAGADDLGAVRQSEVEALVQRFSYLAVQRYVRPARQVGNLAEFGLGPPQIELQLVVGDGADARTIVLEVGGRVEDGNEYWLASSESEFLMTWPAALVTHFELDVERRLFDPKGN